MQFPKLRLTQTRRGVDLVIVVLHSALLAGILLGCLAMTRAIETNGLAAGTAAVREAQALLVQQIMTTMAQVRALQDLGGQVILARAANSPTAQVLEELLRHQTQLAAPAVLNTGLSSPRGEMEWATVALPSPALNVMIRDDIAAILRGGQDRSVGRPVHGRASDTDLIPFSAAAHDDGGRLAGITTVVLQTGFIAALQRATDQGSGFAVSLFREDGVTLLGRVSSRLITPPTWRSDLFVQALAVGHAEGIKTSQRDQTVRITAYRLLPGLPIVVASSQSLDALMLPYCNVIASYWRLAAAGCAVVIASAAGLLWLRARERRTAALLARESQARLGDAMMRLMTSESPDGYTLRDRNLKFLYANPAAEKIMGLAAGNLTTAQQYQRIIEEDQPLAALETARVLRDGGVAKYTARVTRVDGSRRWLEIRKIGLDPDAEESQGAALLAIVRDITEQKDAEEALAAARETVALLLRSSAGFVNTFDAADLGKGGISLVVPPECEGKLLGYTVAQFAEPGFATSRLHPDDVRLLRDSYGTLFNGARSAECECRMFAADGQERWLRSTCARISTASTVIVQVCMDVTGEVAKRRQEARVDRHETLGRVVTGIAHEFNQPLAAISLAAENGLRQIDRGGANPARLAGKFRRILDNVLRLGRAVDHVRGLDVPNEAGVAFRMVDVVEAALRRTETGVTALNLSVSVDVPDDLPAVMGLPDLLTDALVSLLVNVGEAYDRRPGLRDVGRSIRINALATKHTLILRVADDAGGIPHGMIDRVFEAYFTTKEVGQGSGLGLSTASASVHGMGGSIVARNVDIGAELEIMLPLTA